MRMSCLLFPPGLEVVESTGRNGKIGVDYGFLMRNLLKGSATIVGLMEVLLQNGLTSVVILDRRDKALFKRTGKYIV